MLCTNKFFKKAQAIAQKATCTRARCGSIIVAADGEIIGKGFNAPPQNDESQRMCSAKLDKTIKQNYDKTCCLHAEWNAIIDALQHNASKIVGATLYFMRVDEAGDFTEAGQPYCTVCSRLALQSGIATFGLWNNGPEMIPASTYNVRSYSYFIQA